MSIDVAFVRQFSDQVVHLAQQKMSRLRGCVRSVPVVGKSRDIDRIGLQTAEEIVSRHQATPTSDSVYSRRRLNIRDFGRGEIIDPNDELKLLLDPRNAVAVSLASALARKIDDVIVDAADGNAVAVDNVDGTSNVAIAHTVDEDFNTANSDIIVEKVVEALRILKSNEVDVEGDELFFVLDATAQANMLLQTEVGSFDYNSVKALAQGDLKTFCGFKFIQSERLNDSSEGFKNCLAFAKSGICLGVAQDPKVEFTQRADLRNALQAYASMSIGAVRVEEEKVVVVEAYRA